jgi:hypothetical protein
MVKWVCYFINQRNKECQGHLLYKDITTDLFFFLLEHLYNNYPQDSDGIPSQESVTNVRSYFLSIEKNRIEEVLKGILSKEREKGIETNIYSIYKASSYYLNLSYNKLHFLNEKGEVSCWSQRQLTKAVLKSGINEVDRKIYFRQILQYDGHFFLSMCLLQKPVKKYDLKMEDEIFKFMQRYYPISNFEYTKQSHSNYYVVRKRWIELLKAINDGGTLSKILINIIKDDCYFEAVYQDVENNVKDFANEIRKKSIFIKNKKKFIAIYQKLVQTSGDKSSFVNLYDISKELRMSFQRFQVFLTQFYQEERLVRNIFFVNVVSTIEQRKRFYIGNSPVIKIKISKYYGA